eukprot:COSAG05_NODE_2466_length_3028_cov_21.087060_3_plen_69_part_00
MPRAHLQIHTVNNSNRPGRDEVAGGDVNHAPIEPKLLNLCVGQNESAISYRGMLGAKTGAEARQLRCW